jgi:hypothetical protein
MLKQLLTATALIATTATAGLAQDPLYSMSGPMDNGCHAQLTVDFIDSEGDVSMTMIEDCGHRYERNEAWVRCVTPSGLAWFAEKGASKFSEVEPGSSEAFLAGIACDQYFWGNH